jgi:hypothetical protein
MADRYLRISKPKPGIVSRWILTSQGRQCARLSFFLPFFDNRNPCPWKKSKLSEYPILNNGWFVADMYGSALTNAWLCVDWKTLQM